MPRKSRNTWRGQLGTLLVGLKKHMAGKTLENLAQYRMWKKSLKLKSQTFRRAIEKRAASRVAQVPSGRGEVIRMRRSG